MALPQLESPARFVLRFGAGRSTDEHRVALGLPVLAGEPCENLFPTALPAGRVGDFNLYRDHDWLLGCALLPAGALEAATRELYRQLLEISGDHALCRIWNYVPGINAIDGNGLENYQAFSRGRSVAFEQHLGVGFKRRLPAASAVGSDDSNLAVFFAANRAQPNHRENPRQIPAYEYPPQYGPRPPSFARATIVPRPDGGNDVFISGTSAITGHATIAPGDTAAQTRCTLANLREISKACDLGEDLAAGRAVARHIKIYLRRASDYPEVAPMIDQQLTHPGDIVSYVAADICRATLNVEIELTLFGVESSKCKQA